MFVHIFSRHGNVMLLLLQKVILSSVFDEVVRDVSGYCPSIDLPWLDVEIGLANIKQNCVQPDDKCEQSADSDQSDTDHLSTVNNTSHTTAAAADYSHLYIYKKNTSAAASWSRKADDYIALSSSSDEDETECQPARVADVSRDDDDDNDGDAVAVSSVAVADSTPTASSRRTKYSQLYRSPNTGVQIANPNKKKNKKWS